MEDKVYITGHRNPDTDSICSAIAYAHLKRMLGLDASAVRIGRVNNETAFVLDYFGIKEPEYLPTVKTQVQNLRMDIIKPITTDISLREAWQLLKECKTGVLPVVSDGHRLCGIVSVSDIANAYINMPESNTLALSNTPVENIVRTLDAKLVYDAGRAFTNSGRVLIAAMTTDALGAYIKEGDIVLAGDRKENQEKAVDEGAFCVIVTCGSEVGSGVVAKAKAKNCTLLVTEHDTYTTARLLYQSVPVTFFMTPEKKLVLFRQDDYIDAVREEMLKTRYRSYPVVDGSGRFVGFISRYHMIEPNRKKVILVDHNERAQTINGIDQAEILEIVDHHRIGDIQTGSPIYYRNEPVGSTATIVANLFFENGITPPGEIAGILCAAILSDTVIYKSPTSTEADLKAGRRLAEISGIMQEEFAKKMFEAGSALKNKTPEEILLDDFKEYSIGLYNIGIGQINTGDLRGVRKIRAAVLSYMNRLVSEGRYFIVLLIITDIMNEETEVIFSETRKGMVAKVFNPLNDENSFSLKGVVSRKKQIVPKITNLLLNN
ncbi:MAG: putative manganese-dependent inorganic diphosphatase [Bacillota bacterium]|nr:putative manganese-dependent inorganic diphosphatase [Bacillota bacterium]